LSQCTINICIYLRDYRGQTYHRIIYYKSIVLTAIARFAFSLTVAFCSAPNPARPISRRVNRMGLVGAQRKSTVFEMSVSRVSLYAGPYCKRAVVFYCNHVCHSDGSRLNKKQYKLKVHLESQNRGTVIVYLY